ncbi:MAG: lipid-A-disaccharide synthase [Candidatus Omnitrophota bacterium]
MKKIVFVAGDRSGDIYGGLLAEKLKLKFPGIKLFSFGGRNLARNCNQIIDLTSYSVCGLIEVISSMKTLLEVFDKTFTSINRLCPDLIILIDFPDFNLRLAKKLKKKYPIFYYVSPQVWAWRKKRINLIKEYIGKMIVIFKFEQEFYKKEGIDALYFGHPLLEIIPQDETTSEKSILLMPGSRKNEIKHNLPIMLKAKNILSSKLKNYNFTIVRPHDIDTGFYDQFKPGLKIEKHSYEVIKKASFIITSSGTATVEIAIMGIPFLIIYKVNSLTWALLRKMVKTDYVGMVNILSSKMIIKELLQGNASPEIIAAETLSILNNRVKYLSIKEDLKSLKATLSPYGACENFAGYIGDYLEI